MKKKNRTKSKFQVDLEEYCLRMIRTCYELRLPSYDVDFEEYINSFNINFHTRGLKDTKFKIIMKPVKEKLLKACYDSRNKVFILDFDEYQKCIYDKLNYIERM